MPKYWSIGFSSPSTISRGLLLLYPSGPSDTNQPSARLDPASQMLLEHRARRCVTPPQQDLKPPRGWQDALAPVLARAGPGCDPAAICCILNNQCFGASCPIMRYRTVLHLPYLLDLARSQQHCRELRMSEPRKVRICHSYHKTLPLELRNNKPRCSHKHHKGSNTIIPPHEEGKTSQGCVPTSPVELLHTSPVPAARMGWGGDPPQCCWAMMPAYSLGNHSQPQLYSAWVIFMQPTSADVATGRKTRVMLTDAQHPAKLRQLFPHPALLVAAVGWAAWLTPCARRGEPGSASTRAVGTFAWWLTLSTAEVTMCCISFTPRVTEHQSARGHNSPLHILPAIFIGEKTEKHAPVTF